MDDHTQRHDDSMESPIPVDSTEVTTSQADQVDPAAVDSPPKLNPLDHPKFCPVCRLPTEYQPLSYFFVRQWLNTGYVHSIFDFETLHFEEYSCRRCGAADRERLFALYLDRAWKDPGKILEIAPRVALTTYLKQLPGAEVRTADLLDPAADDKIDLTNMPIYSNGQFNAWICSHVLEHIHDDRQAMRELYRILAPGGFGLVLVPICRSLNATHEDPTIEDPKSRWKYFAQDDHVRLYEKLDFVSRLTQAGFHVEQFSADFFGSTEFTRAGIDQRSVLYVCHKH